MSHQPSGPWSTEARGILRLGGPLVVAFAGNQALGVVDTLVAGHFDPDTLAGVGLGGALYFLCVVLGFGVMMGLDPIAAQAVGAGDEAAARRGFNDTVWLAALLGPALMCLAWFYSPPLLDWVSAPAPAWDETMAYIGGRLWGTFPMLLLMAQRSYLQAHDITRPIMNVVILANLVNLPLSSYLGAGDQAFAWIGLEWQTGFAGWGSHGIGIASSAVAVVQAVVLGLYVRRLPKPAGDLSASRAGVVRVLRVGGPIGLALFGEAGVFTLVSVLMATFGTVAIGGHQIALQLASFTFTVCLGISSATTVRVGQAVGRGDGLAARRAGLVGVCLGVGFMLVTASIFTFAPEHLAERFTADPAIVALAATLLQIAGAFQIVDGIQAVMAGALRGLADTTFAMGVAVGSFWGIGLPVGWWLAESRGMGPEGLWWGLTTGLAVVALVLSVRFLSIVTRVRAIER